MIEVSSAYPSVSSLNSDGLQPYLEVYGETEPLVCNDLAETLSADSKNNDLQMEAGVPIYEYYWTLGISNHLYELITHGGKHDKAAEVTLYFPLNGGWRVYEIVATIRYIRPLPHRDQENLLAKVADYWKTVSPVVESAAEVARNLPPPLSISSTILHLLAKLQITALPPVEGLAWSIKRITGPVEKEIMDGVRWTIPQEVFEVLGSRLTGSIAVFFHPSQDSAASVKQAEFQPKAIRAEAVVYPPKSKDCHRAPENKDTYVELSIQPSLKVVRKHLL